jgi:hypothetical protein
VDITDRMLATYSGAMAGWRVTGLTPLLARVAPSGQVAAGDADRALLEVGLQDLGRVFVR